MCYVYRNMHRHARRSWALAAPEPIRGRGVCRGRGHRRGVADVRVALAGKEGTVLEASFEFQEPWRDACIVRGLILTGAARQADFVPYGAERLVRMRTLRLLADVVSVTLAVDAGNRPARRVPGRPSLPTSLTTASSTASAAPDGRWPGRLRGRMGTRAAPPVDARGRSSVLVVSDLVPVLAMIDTGELAAGRYRHPHWASGWRPPSLRYCGPQDDRPPTQLVFPAPARSVLGAKTYDEACTRSVAVCGKSISRQGFGIVPKVASVDLVMTPARQDALFEVHPEVSFTAMAGRPMTYYKARPEGRAERLALLRREFPDLDQHAGTRLPGTNPDDVLDAFATAWSARRRLRGDHIQLGGDLDERGLRMEIVA